MKNFTLFAIGMIFILLAFSCRTSKEVQMKTQEKQLSEIVRHDTIRIEKHHVDSFYQRDSIFVSQIQERDTVYITKTIFRKQVQTRNRESKSDSIKIKEENNVEEKLESERREITKKDPLPERLIAIGILILIIRIVYKSYKRVKL